MTLERTMRKEARAEKGQDQDFSFSRTRKENPTMRWTRFIYFFGLNLQQITIRDWPGLGPGSKPKACPAIVTKAKLEQTPTSFTSCSPTRLEERWANNRGSLGFQEKSRKPSEGSSLLVHDLAGSKLRISKIIVFYKTCKQLKKC